MARKRFKVSKRMLFTWCVLSGFIFLITPQSFTNGFQFAFARIFRGPLGIGRNISLSARTVNTGPDVVSRREYNKLQNHLSNVIAQRDQERLRVEKLLKLNNKPVWSNAKCVLADVITININNKKNELIINCGSADGLAKGQYVVGDNSIIGRIWEVSSHTALVKLITDPGSSIPVKIGNTGSNMLMRGTGTTAKIQPLKMDSKIGATGAEVFVLKDPKFLAASMKTGEVTKCGKDESNPLLWDIRVKPVCDIEKLADVAVIVTNWQEK